MKALVFKRPGLPLALEDRPDPKPGPGQAVLKVHRCGICGTDLHMTSEHGGMTYPHDRVIGHEYAGEVVEIGQDVTRLKVGDLATSIPTIGCGHCAACAANDPYRCAGKISSGHGFAEYVLVGERSAVKTPEMVSLEDAALTEPLCCGLRGVLRADMQPGARVLVIGAGPIGLAAAYWARRLGAGPVAVTARTRRAAHIALEMGASDFLVSGPDLAREAAEILGGAPDVVFESSGAPGMISRSMDCVKAGGTVSVVGMCFSPDTFNPAEAVMKEVRLIFSFVYDRQDFERSLDVMNSGDVAARAMVTDTISMQEFPAVFEALRTPSDQCKVLLDPWKA